MYALCRWFAVRGSAASFHCSRRSSIGSLNQQQAALLLSSGVERVHRFIESLRFDQPWAVFLVDVENENQVFLAQVSGDGRVMAVARSE